MKTLKLFSVAILCMAITLVSCSGEDGETGPQGPQGLAGLDGLDGVDGEDGADGVSCWDLNGNGTGDAEEDLNDDGNFDALDCQGTDGNANVQSFDIDISSWAGGTDILFDIPIDAVVRANYAFLFYMQFGGGLGNMIHSVPGINPLASSVTTGVHYNNEVNSPNAKIYFVSTSDWTPYDFPGDLYERIIIVAIEKSNSGNKSAQESLITELKKAGVDTSDYDAVAKYFGLE